MKSKNKSFPEQQLLVKSKLEAFLHLPSCNSFFLYNLDRDTDLHLHILSLIPDIKLYFPVVNLVAVSKPDTIKRSWLSIIKYLLKPHYDIYITNSTLTVDDKKINTKKYTFIKKTLA